MDIINMNDWVKKNKSKGINFDADFETLTERETKLILKSISDLTFQILNNVENLTKTEIEIIENINDLRKKQNVLLEYLDTSASLLETLFSFKESSLTSQEEQRKDIDKILKHLNL